MTFGWGATEGSPDTMSAVLLNARGQPSVDPQKTAHSAFQLNWCVPVQSSMQNAAQPMAGVDI